MKDQTKICLKHNSEFKGKVCKLCQKEYNAEYYKKHKAKIIAASTEWCKNNKIKKAEIAKKWRENHPDKAKSMAKSWYARNPDIAYANARNWASKNPELVKKYAAKNREKNKSVYREIHAKYRKENRIKYAVYQQNRRARTVGKLSNNLTSILMKSQNGNCAICKNALNGDVHLDHIIPLVLGGKNIDENIQLTHSRCNMMKGAKHPEEFMKSFNSDTIRQNASLP